MNAKQFSILLNKGNSLEKEDFQALVKLHETFPYFVLPKILAAKYERETTGGASTELLHWAAVQSPNRSRLKQLIEQEIDFLPPATDRAATLVNEETIAYQSLPPAPPSSEAEPASPDQTREEILKRLEENLNRFKKASKKTTEKPQGDNRDKEEQLNKDLAAEDLIATIKKKEKKVILDARKKEQNDLIKAFSKKSIQLAAIKENQDAAKLTDLSENSTVFNDKIVSESFAKLLVKQNKKDQAIEIYQKLRLKFPDKTAYFAALIKELED